MTKEPEQLVEHFFRHESAKLVAALTRGFGFALIDVIEEMVQESMLEALRCWRQRGVPENPAAWLHRVARNRLIDVLRRDRQRPLGDELEVELPGQRMVSFEADELQDSVLRMIFACCHPTLDRSAQLAMTLKLVCGLGDHEIARGLLISKEAAKKRVTRAKRSLQLEQVALTVPPAALLNERLDAVHDVLYLMFNEGYCASRGESPIRIDLCEEAARLCLLLCEEDAGSPTTCALLALMLFHAARLESRLTEEQAVVLLQDQDRSRWDRDMMRVAEYWLTRSVRGKEITRFHLEAGIARTHCRAQSIEDTDWPSIIRHYDLLIEMMDSPIYRLNRAIAMKQIGQVDEALDTMRSIESQLRSYPLIHCAIADVLWEKGDHHQAMERLQTAVDQSQAPHEKALLKQRIADLRERIQQA